MEHSERSNAKTEAEALAGSRWGPKQYDQAASLGRWKQFVPTLKDLCTKKA
jgi:hypothetical protein